MQSQFCETSAKVTNWVNDPFQWLCEHLWLEGENFDVSPKFYPVLGVCLGWGGGGASGQ